jgi:3-phenylpropionate/trans-cinnamate dioxygenase ferredoxin reductase component
VGFAVDANGAASVPDVYAAGDCASFRNRFADRAMRLESVQNAADQARAVAAHCVGQSDPLTAVPWFWTDQHDLKIQMAGLMTPGSREILRGDPASGAFTLLHLCGDRLVAAFSVNRAGDHMAARKLIDRAAELDPSRAGDVDMPLSQAEVVARGDLHAAALS